jgi:hypothetical protein
MRGHEETGDDRVIGSRLRAGLEEVPAPPPPALGRVVRRARVLRARRYAVAAAAVAVVAGLALPLGSLFRLGAPTSMGPVPGAGAEEPLVAPPAPVLEVVCDGATTTVATPTVRARADGVHLRVDNRSGGPLTVSVRAEGRALFGARVAAGVSEPRPDGGAGWSVPPGVASVGCFPPGTGEEGAGYATFQVVDPQGLWVPWELECREGSVTAAIDRADPRGEPGDPVDVAWPYLAPYLGSLGQGDRLERAGYPDQVPVVVRVARDGRTVATAELTPGEGGGWVVSTVSVCEEAVAR